MVNCFWGGGGTKNGYEMVTRNGGSSNLSYTLQQAVNSYKVKYDAFFHSYSQNKNFELC